MTDPLLTRNSRLALASLYFASVPPKYAKIMPVLQATTLVSITNNFVSFNSVCNHTRDIEIGRPRMISDRIVLPSVLLPLLGAPAHCITKRSEITNEQNSL